MFFKLFVRILGIFLMVFMGYLARRTGMIDTESSRKMARVSTNFLYPALIFSALVGNYTLAGLLDNWALPVGAVMIMAAGYLIGLLFSRLISFSDDREKHGFMFQCTINNYSFLPLPLILMLWGNQGVARLLFASVGSEIAVWTLGVFALTGNKLTRESLRHLASVPMLAVVAAIVMIIVKSAFAAGGLLPLPGSPAAEIGGAFLSALDIFGKGTIPLAMFVAGSRMAELKVEHLMTGQQAYLVVLRLLLIPAAAASLLYVLPFAPDIRLILLTVAVMPSAIASVVLSEVYDADARFAASAVLLTHLFALLTIPAWLSLFM